MKTNVINSTYQNTMDNGLVSALARTFTSHFQKSAKNILEMSKVAHEAKTKLTKSQFREFAFQIGFSESSATLKKLQVIGEKYELFTKNVNYLPPNWTSLYLLTQLADDKFSYAIDKGLITQDLKGKEIRDLLGKTQTNASKKEQVPNRNNTINQDGYRFIVKLSSFPNKKILEKIGRIIKECQSIETAEVDCGDLREFLEPNVIEAETRTVAESV